MTGQSLQQLADPQFPQERIDDLAEERAYGGSDSNEVDPDFAERDYERAYWRGFGE